MNGDTLLQFIGFVLWLLSWLIIARALLSWFPNTRGNPIVELINQITDPIMVPLSRLIPRIGMIDISPIVAIIVLRILAASLGGPVI